MRVAADVIVVGGGAAGLCAAITLAAGRRVLLLTKTALAAGGASARAQGGIAAALGPGDSPDLHSRDTLAAGDGLCDPTAVAVLVREGPGQVRALAGLGARFDRAPDGGLALGREAAHSRSRIVHAGGDATGAELVRALVDALEAHRAAGRIDVVERAFAEDLIVDGGACVGVVARLADGRRLVCGASYVVLATGGAGRVYACTTNPLESTGDGIAMAARAGARLRDLEFVQFHPTALDAGTDPLPLLTEAIRGDGAALVDGHGRRFMVGEHPLAELAPRDVVARAIWRRRRAGERVYLDATGAPGVAFPDRFPGAFALCLRHGLDPRRDPLPVTPAAHYLMGGITVDLAGRTSLPGLYACGETACTGVHGANRLASNSLLESVVFADRAARDILALGPRLKPRRGTAAAAALARPFTGSAESRLEPRTTGDAGPGAAHPALRQARGLMWERVGLERDAAGLTTARERLAALALALPPGPGEAANVLLVARLIAEAALARRESRGSHYRLDDPGLARRAG